MTFASGQFFVFFLIFAPLYFTLPVRLQGPALLAGSLVFYAAGEPLYLPVLGLVILVSWLAGRAMAGKEKKEERRRPMWLGVITCLSILLFFKYSNIAGGLPLGISFFTLAAVGYLVDCYRSHHEPETSPARVALFVSFFPLILSGPIERAPKLMKQLFEEHRFDESRVVSGLLLFAWGMFKKVAVADRLGLFTSGAFRAPDGVDGWWVLLATAFACVQLYCDFSGYSDMAIGIAKTLGIDVMENFKRPFLAASIEDLWGKRWHLALTTWMKDYVFNPLSYLMRRQPAARRHMIILLVFFLTGLWHGAELKFMAWGLLNGVFVLVHVLTAAQRKKAVAALGLERAPRLHRVLATGFTVSLFGLGAIVFLAPSFAAALTLYGRLFAGWTALSPGAVVRAVLAAQGPINLGLALFGTGVLGVVELIQENAGSLRARVLAQPAWVRWPAYYVLVLAVALLGVFQREAFIYQQF